MKVYALTFARLSHGEEDSEGSRVAWYASVRQAKAELNRLRRDGELDLSYPVTLTPHNIPTKLDGLLTWLNIHFDKDNG